MTTRSSAPAAVPTTPTASRKTNTVVLTLMAAVFLALLDSQIIATALPRVVGDLGGLDQFAWATTGYLIGGSAALPVYGKLGDLFGRKRIFVGSLVVFLVASAACGLAQTMGQLIAFRVVQGIGSGGLFICVLAIIGEMFGYREGARYYGWISITFGAASIAGPTLGGILTEFASWRWVFFVNLPIGAVVLLIVVTMLDLPARPQKARIDYAGVVLLTVSIVALNLFAGWGGVKYAWTSPAILALAAGSALAIALFILVQRRAADPVVPLRLFSNSSFSIIMVLNFIGGFVGLGLLNYLVLWLQAVASLDVQKSGYVLTAMMLAVVVSSWASAKAIGATGSYRWHPTMSMALFAVTAVLFLSAGPGSGVALTIGYMVMFGVAAGLNMQALSIAARSTATMQDIGAVQGTATLMRQLGTALGVSFFGALMASRLATGLQERFGSDSGVHIDKDGSLSPEVLAGLSAPARLDLATVYADSLRPVFVAVIPLVLIGLLAAFFLKDAKPAERLAQAAPGEPPAGETSATGVRADS